MQTCVIRLLWFVPCSVYGRREATNLRKLLVDHLNSLSFNQTSKRLLKDQNIRRLFTKIWTHHAAAKGPVADARPASHWWVEIIKMSSKRGGGAGNAKSDKKTLQKKKCLHHYLHLIFCFIHAHALLHFYSFTRVAAPGSIDCKFVDRLQRNEQ